MQGLFGEPAKQKSERDRYLDCKIPETKFYGNIDFRTSLTPAPMGNKSKESHLLSLEKEFILNNIGILR